MITKKLLTLGLALSLLSPISSFAGMGTETSGGGDAVYINNQMVIRDLLMHDQLTMLINRDFLNEVPKFRILIGKIAQANPDFAYKVIYDLVNARIYMSPKSIPVLPYEQTTIAGKPADVQLAVRDKNDIIFAPEFESSNQKEYILLHEALHGILTDNVGAMHHQRVRNVVKYVYDNQDKLDEKQFTDFLVKNNYDATKRPFKDTVINGSWVGSDVFSFQIKLALDLKADNRVRCSYGGFIKDLLLNFEGLDCDKENNLENFLEEKEPELMQLDKLVKAHDVYNHGYRLYDIEVFTLTKDSFLNTKKKKTQMNSCKNNNENLVQAQKGIDFIKNNLALLNKTKVIFDSKKYSYAEKYAVLSNTVGAKNGIAVDISIGKLKKSSEWIMEKMQLLKTQQSACQNQYPELF